MLLKKIVLPALACLLLLACESPSDEIARRSAEAARNSAASASTGPDGSAVFRKYCVACHGADGKLALNGAKDLTASTLTLDERIQMVTKGKGLMTPFGEMLTPEEIRAVAEYTLTLKK